MPASARNEGAPSAGDDASDDAARAVAGDRLRRPAEGARRRRAEGHAPPGLPPDARPAEGHRRGGRGHARSPARRASRSRRWTSASTSTSRSRCAGRWPRPGSWPGAPPRPRWSRRWATRATRPTMGALVVEYLQAGALGAVTEVHVWTNRPLGFWPQGVPRPAATTRPADGMRWNGPGITARLGAAMRPLPRAGGPGLGSLPRSGAVRRVPPGVSPVQLARLGRLGRRSARRHGRASDRPRLLGASISACRRRSKPSRRRSTTSPSRTPR